MIAAFVIVFAVTQYAYCIPLSSLPQSSHVIVQLLDRDPLPLIRHARQSGFDYNPYDMYPDTGKNPNTYPQQQQQSNNNNGFPFAVNNFPTIFGKK